MFYGWKIVAALFVVLAVASGLGFYNQSVMIEALVSRGFDISTASTSVSIFFLSSGIFGPLLATVIERIDIRYVITGGAVLGGLSLSVLGAVETTTQLYVCQFLFGIGFCAAGLLPATTLIARWFVSRRAAALSLASTGLSVGGIVVTPASAALIASIGFETAAVWLGIVWFVGIAPLAVVIVRPSPANIGQLPDGGAADEAADGSGIPDGMTFSEAIRGFYFWGLGGAWTFVMLAQVGGIAHQFGVVATRFEQHQAPFVLGVLPLFSIIGRLVGGYILDRGVAIRPFTFSMMLLQVIALVTVSVDAHPFVLVLGLALFGVTVGNLLMLQPLLVADAYGARDYARLYSINNVLTMAGVAGGPLLMGLLIADAGGYTAAYLLAAYSTNATKPEAAASRYAAVYPPASAISNPINSGPPATPAIVSTLLIE